MWRKILGNRICSARDPQPLRSAFVGGGRSAIESDHCRQIDGRRSIGTHKDTAAFFTRPGRRVSAERIAVGSVVRMHRLVAVLMGTASRWSTRFHGVCVMTAAPDKRVY